MAAKCDFFRCSLAFHCGFILMSQSNCDAINETKKRPPTAHIEDGTRQRQARIGLAEADGTEDDEVACRVTEPSRGADSFNVTQKHLVPEQISSCDSARFSPDTQSTPARQRMRPVKF